MNPVIATARINLACAATMLALSQRVMDHCALALRMINNGEDEAAWKYYKEVKSEIDLSNSISDDLQRRVVSRWN